MVLSTVAPEKVVKSLQAGLATEVLQPKPITQVRIKETSQKHAQKRAQVDSHSEAPVSRKL